MRDVRGGEWRVEVRVRTAAEVELHGLLVTRREPDGHGVNDESQHGDTRDGQRVRADAEQERRTDRRLECDHGALHTEVEYRTYERRVYRVRHGATAIDAVAAVRA
jgi:hypothetical protein